MKNIILFFFLLTSFISKSQTFNYPYVTRQDVNKEIINIYKIENNSTNTIVYIQYENVYQNEQNSWINIQPHVFLRETIGSRQFKFVKAEGVPVSPTKFNFTYKGEKILFKLYFQKVPFDVKQIDLIECENQCFNFYGIKLDANNTIQDINYSNNIKNNLKKDFKGIEIGAMYSQLSDKTYNCRNGEDNDKTCELYLLDKFNDVFGYETEKINLNFNSNILTGIIIRTKPFTEKGWRKEEFEDINNSLEKVFGKAKSWFKPKEKERDGDICYVFDNGVVEILSHYEFNGSFEGSRVIIFLYDKKYLELKDRKKINDGF